ncbi:unnamed protein product [Miscanthus lutarioriparius]|uniref:Uncharacterized protein n=1 Tax=Miscanthus lutarioriparius TaxID=422564 RepID=A0A811NGN9_9POAL|nr:unnamed protein product [Miscanthus lutarioriparius]
MSSATAALEPKGVASVGKVKAAAAATTSTTVGHGGNIKAALPNPFGRGNNPAEAAPIPIGRGHGYGDGDGDGGEGDWPRPRPIFRPRSWMLECGTDELFQRPLAALQEVSEEAIMVNSNAGNCFQELLKINLYWQMNFL